jgi:hypothetical protein
MQASNGSMEEALPVWLGGDASWCGEGWGPTPTIVSKGFVLAQDPMKKHTYYLIMLDHLQVHAVDMHFVCNLACAEIPC